MLYGLSLANRQKWCLVDTTGDIPWFKEFVEVYGFETIKNSHSPKIIISRNNSETEPLEEIIARLPKNIKNKIPAAGWQSLNSKRPQLWFHTQAPDIIYNLPASMEDLNHKKRISEIISDLLFPIYIQAFTAGGLTIHSALIAFKNNGFLLVGHSGAGKSTCCQHLPYPWLPLCEEEVLVIHNKNGQYFAHPFPNLNDFVSGERKRRYNVQQPVPVKGIFFLEHGKTEKASPLGGGKAATLIYRSASEISLRYRKNIPDSLSPHRKKQFENACNIIIKIPVFTLSFTPDGQFWNEIIRALNLSLKPDKFLLYSGPSMNFTLKPLDRLQIIPGSSVKIRRGDVIVFTPPGEGEKEIAHRVISVSPEGIRTAGDNNTTADPWLLNTHHIIGRVTFVYRGNQKLRVYGGRIGIIFASYLKVLRYLKNKMIVLSRPFYHWLASKNLFYRIFSKIVKMRLLSFTNSHGETELQLYIGNLQVGKRRIGNENWQIRRPFKLFIDPEILP